MGHDFEKAMQRPKNFFKLSGQAQWDIDFSLGILDWDGDCPHAAECCPECDKKFQEYFKDQEV